MTKPHPLTDKMIEDIAYETIHSDETVRTGGLGVPRYFNGRVMLRYADMRAAYKLGIQACVNWLLAYPSRQGCSHITLERISAMMEEELLIHKKNHD